MLKFTVHITAVHLFTCVAKVVTSRGPENTDLSDLSTVGTCDIFVDQMRQRVM